MTTDAMAAMKALLAFNKDIPACGNLMPLLTQLALTDDSDCGLLPLKWRKECNDRKDLTVYELNQAVAGTMFDGANKMCEAAAGARFMKMSKK